MTTALATRHHRGEQRCAASVRRTASASTAARRTSRPSLAPRSTTAAATSWPMRPTASRMPVLQSTPRLFVLRAAARRRRHAGRIAAAGDFNCGGSATSASAPLLRPSNDTPSTSDGNASLVPGATPFNFAPYNYFQRPDERYTFGAFADYEISPGAKPYLEAMFMDDHIGRADRAVGRLRQHQRRSTATTRCSRRSSCSAICTPTRNDTFRRRQRSDAGNALHRSPQRRRRRSR